MTTINIFEAANQFGYADVLLALDAQNARLVSLSPTLLQVQLDQFLFSGFGNFILSGQQLIGGTLQSYQLRANGVLVGEVRDFDISVTFLATASEDQINRALTAGDDTVTSAWNQGDVFETFGGNDSITLGSGDDTVDGGSGTDRFIVQSDFAKTKVTLLGDALRLDGPQGLDTIRNIETLQFQDQTFTLSVGTIAPENLTGDSNPALLRDLMFGGGADDGMSGGDGADIINGGGGFDNISGDQGRDLLIGDGGFDALNGGSGSDRLLGGAGRDTLKGDGGNDRLAGQKGKDTLIGGRGDDSLTGGGGKDTFQFRKGHGNDTITDFTIGVDKVIIGLGANRFSQLDFEKQGTNVLVSFADVEILFENIALSALNDSSNFFL